MRANPMRYLVLAALVFPSCKEKGQPPPPAEAQLSTDLPEGMIETVLKLIERNGGPRAERIPGMQAGVSALLGAYGGMPAEPAPLGDVRWDSEPYGAIATAAYGKLMPGPISGKDVPPLWRDPGGTWVAVGGRALLLLVGIDDLGDHGAPVRFTALTEPWLKGAHNKEVAARVLRASFQGWVFCRDHPADCVDIVLKQDATGVMTKKHQSTMMAEVNKLIWGPPAPAHGIGYMEPAAFGRTAEIALRFGVIKKPASDAAFTHAIWETAQKIK